MKTWIPRTYVSFIYGLLYLPIGVLILYSFNDARFSLVWHHTSWRWYVELLNDGALWQAFTHSLCLGLCASLAASGMGFLASARLFLTRKPNQPLFTLLVLLMILPDLIFGVALLVFFNWIGMHLGFMSLFIAHVTFCLPFTLITIHNRMHAVDINLYYSAVDLGASHTRALTHILLPLVWPAILSAFLLGFTLSFDDVVISYFVAGPEFSLLPLTIYSLVRSGVTPELNALCSMTFLLSMFLVILAHQLARSKR